MAEPTGPAPIGFFPGRAAIDAFGGGGFRFAGMSHRGSLLLLPSGIKAWPVVRFEDLSEGSFAPVIAERANFEFLLLGTGREQKNPASEIKALFDGAGLGLEAMSTGAACRTYNILLDEGRAVAAALIAVG